MRQSSGGAASLRATAVSYTHLARARVCVCLIDKYTNGLTADLRSQIIINDLKIRVAEKSISNCFLSFFKDVSEKRFP